MIEYLQSIADEIKDLFAHDIETTKCYVVPGRNDAGLTFGRNQLKKGKLIETCVLFIDIRNSTLISRSLRKDKATLGKIYSAFIQAMTSIADKYGFVRNIIGDRVMVVFEPGNCYVDAVDCAITMYTVSQKMLKKYSSIDFNVGIGIEWGEMLVLKAGIAKQHEEQSEYKNLVWIGDTANIASKLTDLAGSKFSECKYKITYEHTDLKPIFKGFKEVPGTSIEDIFMGNTRIVPDYDYEFKRLNNVVILSSAEFGEKIDVSSNPWKYERKNIVNLEKTVSSGTASNILMSGKVYNEYKKSCSQSPFLKRLEKKQYPSAPYTGTGIFGGNYVWPEIIKVKL